MPKCDIDDILCQIEVLGHLRGMKKLLGQEEFTNKFPKFKGLADTLSENITSQSATLKEALEGCGLIEENMILSNLLSSGFETEEG